MERISLPAPSCLLACPNAEEPYLYPVARALRHCSAQLVQALPGTLGPVAGEFPGEVLELNRQPQPVHPLAGKPVKIVLRIVVDVVHKLVAVERRALYRPEEASGDPVAQPRRLAGVALADVVVARHLARKVVLESPLLGGRLRRGEGNRILCRALDSISTCDIREAGARQKHTQQFFHMTCILPNIRGTV